MNRTALLLSLVCVGCVPKQHDDSLPRYVLFAKSPLSMAEMKKFEGRWGSNDPNDEDVSYSALRALRAGAMEMQVVLPGPDGLSGVGLAYFTSHAGQAYLQLNWIDWKWKPKPPLPASDFSKDCYAVSRIWILPNGDVQTEMIDWELTITGNPTIKFAHRASGWSCLSHLFEGLSDVDREKVVLFPSQDTPDSPPNIMRLIKPREGP